jgi:hypothetical protein
MRAESVCEYFNESVQTNGLSIFVVERENARGNRNSVNFESHWSRLVRGATRSLAVPNEPQTRLLSTDWMTEVRESQMVKHGRLKKNLCPFNPPISQSIFIVAYLL